MKRAVAAASALALMTGYYAFGPEQGIAQAIWADRAAVNYRTAPVERGDLVSVVTATGAVQPVSTVLVGTQVSGQITELNTDFNAEVRKGDVLAVIDQSTFEVVVQQAEAELEFAQASVLVQQAVLERAEADLTTAVAELASANAQTQRAKVEMAEQGRDLIRKKSMAAKGATSAAEREKSQSAYDAFTAVLDAQMAQEYGRTAAVEASEAEVRSAEAQMATALATVKQREAALRQAQRDLEKTIIRAPVDGVVLEKAVEAGQTVAASLEAPTLFLLAPDLREMQIQASVDEADVGRIRDGQAVQFTVDAFPDQTFEGKVLQIRKAPSVVQYVVTYLIIISAPNPDKLLLPGMTANVRVITTERKNVLRVPNAALRYQPDENAEESDIPLIWLLEDEEPVPMPVEVGATDGTHTEIKADLVPGQTVIVGHDEIKSPSAARRVLGAGY